MLSVVSAVSIWPRRRGGCRALSDAFAVSWMTLLVVLRLKDAEEV